MKLLIYFCIIILCNVFTLLSAQQKKIDIQLLNKERIKHPISINLSDSINLEIKTTDQLVHINNLRAEKYSLKISTKNYEAYETEIDLIQNDSLKVEIDLKKSEPITNVDEVVISGTMKAVKKMDSPVPVEIFTPTFFKKNPTPSIFDALQNINGVRPQLNCNICNTGDIHINGLEGPYTMVLIDGMPIVSSLGTVYGLSGIPNALVERIEIVKGPASSLYGSEAVGGLINIITKKPLKKNFAQADMMTTSWGEYNLDLGSQISIGKKIKSILGINYFNYQNRADLNHDGFTDVTLQDRLSIFQKMSMDRNDGKTFTMALRYLYEERWGGETLWTKNDRGSDNIYAESIYTNRIEWLGNYQLPTKEKIFWNYSAIYHDQNSRYGKTSFNAQQKIIFNQITWEKKWRNHDLLSGIANRYTIYDDNTTATAHENMHNKKDKINLPGIFFQDEIKINHHHNLLLGLRLDHHPNHGEIFTPRFAYLWKINELNSIRLNAGTGFRVVQLFTEDHAALTGAREVIIIDHLKPEKSYNANLNYVKKIFYGDGHWINLDTSIYYTYFTNKIVPDYLTDTNKIIYDNLDGYAVSKGASINIDLNLTNGLKILLGGTIMSNNQYEQGKKQNQLLTEKFSATWSISYKIKPLSINLDYTGNLYSPMQLPLLGALDPRPEWSPWWSIQNIQMSYDGLKNFEIYAGVKNLLNWIPAKAKNTPFIIARADDPFDHNVSFDQLGNVIPTVENPYALTFDPSYVYAPNQGIRFFIGLRYTLK